MMQYSTPLLMIHGLFGSLDYFEPAARLPQFNIHTPDLLGYGRRPKPQITLTLAAQADEIVRYLSESVQQPCNLLGHSVGGAVAMLVAAHVPELVHSVISVEGNFTLEDAFMCRRIASMLDTEWAEDLPRIQANPETWLEKGGISPTPERLRMAENILHNQSAQTLYEMAHAVVKETAASEYLETVRAVMAHGIPFHLLSGSRSSIGWHVPEWVRQYASSDVVLHDCGHLMMLEDPEQFCQYLSKLG